MKLLLVTISVVLSIAGFSQSTSRPEKIAGFIETVRGVVYLKLGSRKVRLNPQRDVRRALHPNEVLACERDCYALVKLFCGNPDDKNCKPVELRSGEYRVPEITVSSTADRRNHEKAALAYGISAGISMGTLSAVYSPAADSSVRPATLILRWNAVPSMTSFSVNIKDSNGAVIWHDRIEKSSAGQLVSDTLSWALSAYRNKQGTGPLTLEVEDRNHISGKIRFSLLSQSEEKQLDEALAMWDQEDDKFIRHLGRVNAFYSRSMFNDVADEFEAALTETPNSHDLLLRTINAEHTVGNSQRENVLRLRLNSKEP